MLILHGENTVQSRNQLVKELDKAHLAQMQISRIQAKDLDTVQLELLLQSESLFGEPKLVVIEELHTLPKSGKKDDLIKQLATFANSSSNTNSSTSVILWEKRALTATMLKQFKTAQAQSFPFTAALFGWLDSLITPANPAQLTKTLQLLQQALTQDGDFLCLTMFARQIRLLIQAKENTPMAGAPFMIAKLKKQASSFTLDKLLKLHHRVLELDLASKSSTPGLSLPQELAVLMTKL
jgi:DNA polymerase III delta subunit